jgi:hypothetical protein
MKKSQSGKKYAGTTPSNLEPADHARTNLASKEKEVKQNGFS